MDYYDGLSEKEIHYIDEARIIGRTEGNSKRLSDLCHKAYADYATGAISEMAYNKIYAVCMICKPDTKAPTLLTIKSEAWGFLIYFVCLLFSSIFATRRSKSL